MCCATKPKILPIMIPHNHNGILRKLTEFLLNRSKNNSYAWVQGPFGIGKSYIVREAFKNSQLQINNQIIFHLNNHKLDKFVHSFIEAIAKVNNKSQLTNLIDINKISQFQPDLSDLFKTNNKAYDISQLLKSLYKSDQINNSFKLIFQISNQLLCDSKIKFLLGIKLCNPISTEILECLIKYLPNSNIIPVLICDEMSNVIYFYKNLASENSFILDVQEAEENFIRNYIKINVTKFAQITDAILLIAGYNISLINRISNYLRESTQLISADYSDEFYPFEKSREDKVEYELLESQKSSIKNLPNTIFKEDIAEFNKKMDSFLSFPPVSQMKKNMKNNIHFQVTAYETIRYILSKRFLQAYNNNYQKNPIIMGLLYSDIMFYQFSTGKFIVSNNLVKRLVIDYINSQYNSLSTTEMIEYNLNYLLNFKIIQKEVDLSM